MEYLDVTKTLKKNIEHQGIGGQKIVLEFEVDRNEFLKKVDEWNPACVNFYMRRQDLDFEDENFNHKLYYGKVGPLGYVVSDDEFEEENK